MSKWLKRYLPDTHNNTTDSVDTVTTPSRLSVGDSCDIDTMSTVSVSNRHFDETYYKDFFEERSAIAEFDGCQSRAEAEAIAYKDTISEWIYNNPPADYHISKCVYCGYEFDFSAGSYLVWGDVYCCHFDYGKDHLQPYLQSRFNEAATYLKSIGIKQLIKEL